ncbi:MAG: GerAB/ArcD/ProY family transporter [Clostridiales bacterium]|nr:GerAB/ArcD/ProY family transporter [Clostridiales bacterium]
MDTQKDKSTIETKQATGKQLVAIIFMLAMATKMFMLPIMLIQTTGRDGYIIVAIGAAIDLIALGVILVAMHLAGDTDFFTLISRLFGKVGAKIIVAIIGLFMLFKLNVAVAEILTFYGTNVFSDFDTSLMIIVLLAFFCAVAVHTLRALCRLNELLVPIVTVCLTVLIVIVIMTGFDLGNVLPAVRNADKFKTGLTNHAAWLGDFTPLLLFVGRSKMKRFTPLFGAGAGVLGSAVAVFFALVLSAAFGNVPTLIDSTTNLSSILQYTMGNVYGRIDMISSILWSIAVFVEAALFFYCTARCVAFVIGKNAHIFIALGLCVVVYAVQVFALVDPAIFALVVASPASSIVSLVFTVVLPALLLVAAIVDKTKGSAKQKIKPREAV